MVIRWKLHLEFLGYVVYAPTNIVQMFLMLYRSILACGYLNGESYVICTVKKGEKEKKKKNYRIALYISNMFSSFFCLQQILEFLYDWLLLEIGLVFRNSKCYFVDVEEFPICSDLY